MRLDLALAAVLFASPALAQPAPPPAPAEGDATPTMSGDAVEQRVRLMTMDTDHDGKWSKAEWLAGGRRERGFAMMDADGNGTLTAAELEAGLAKLQAVRGARPR